MITGTLNVTGGGRNQKLTLAFNHNNQYQQVSVIAEELSLALLEKKKTAIQTLKNLQVEFELEDQKPKRIRELGQAWDRVAPQPEIKNVSNVNGFHNPYNFIPAPLRNREDSELGDHRPAEHGLYHADLWSGQITVKLTTITPLLIPDAAAARDIAQDHKSYPLRLVDGQLYLPPTSIKGMLRSAYEAITNSRFSIFEKHTERLAFRMPAQQGAVPTRVELRGKPGQEKLYLRLFKKAAKLPRYQENSRAIDKGQSSAALKYPDHTLPQHEDAVWVRIDHQGIVTEIRQCPKNSPAPGTEWYKGWACITGANIQQKTYERVFIESSNDQTILLNDEHKKLWQELILNYQSIHQEDIKKRNHPPQAYLGSEPGKTGFSYHVYTPNQVELRDGILCYTELNGNQVQNLYPVTISRCLYSMSPLELLDESLRPAIEIGQLSPADRVFGWVRQKEGGGSEGAYKGNLRIHSVTCDVNPEDAIDDFGRDGFPLAILGAPKPQQTRFYTASDRKGTPLNQGITKASGCASHKNGLRGRKVYPHHQVPPEHWVNPTENRTQTPGAKGHFQEYRHPADNSDALSDQNRSIQAWVKPGATFTFKMDITNLSSVELGALLWLLQLPEGYYHRLGGAKPLGFGSVRLDLVLEDTDLRTGRDWQDYYSSFSASHHQLSPVDLETLLTAFKLAMSRVYGKGKDKKFEEIPLIKAFGQSAQGFNGGKPIHYPRAKAPNHPGPLPPHPEGKSYEWFVANERTGRDADANAGESLPSLWDERGLQILTQSNP
jgi:CRISPR-associated protein (TIGR03986 family)